MFHQQAIDRINAVLRERHQTIAIAESVTSGLLQAAFSTAQEAMRFYQGGITTYNIGQKARHLGIDPIHALECNCVSQKMAEEMSRGVCRLFTSNWGIGVTGYASRVPESGNKQFAWFAICKDNGIKLSRMIDFKHGSPQQAQLYYVNTILDELSKIVV